MGRVVARSELAGCRPNPKTLPEPPKASKIMAPEPIKGLLFYTLLGSGRS